jgi:hypothetical protein
LKEYLICSIEFNGKILKGRSATYEEITMYHSERLIELVEKSGQMNEQELMALSREHRTVYWHKESNQAAWLGD